MPSQAVRRRVSPTSSGDEGVSSPKTKLKQYAVPNYTVKELLGAIPAHCFERSYIRSFAEVARDFVALSTLAYTALVFHPMITASNLRSVLPQEWISDASMPLLAKALTVAAWCHYWFWAGLFGTGVWILAHECGHQAFSPSRNVNHFMGWVMHSIVLVPYHSWRITHARHHAFNGHVTKDEVFVPRSRSEYGLPPLVESDADDDHHDQMNMNAMDKLDHLLEDAPAWTLTKLIVRQVIGWPLYLIYNVTGQRRHSAFTNHFMPTSSIFEKKHFWQVIISDIGLAIVIGALYYWAQQRSAMEVFLVYGIPYMLVNHWIVAITYLQHSAPIVPHYREGTWNFQRGALCTVDRVLLGWVGAWTTHGISETHVAHHISSKIPHYNAWEATDALREFLGPAYLRIEENVFVSLWKTLNSCKFIEDEGGVVFYKNSKGQAECEGIFVSKNGEVSDSGFETSGGANE